MVQFAKDWFARFFAVQGIDRGMAIGAQAYTALIPLLIVYASVLPRAENKSFADELVSDFKLRGATATSLREAFAPPSTVESGVTVLGVVLLVISALAFTRGLQRLYEGTYGLPSLGVRNTPHGVLWLLFIALVVILRPIVIGPFHGTAETVMTLATAVGIWLATPYLLLGRRVAWPTLLPGAVLTAIGMAGVGVWSVIWMPRTLASSAAQFGVIGVGFALLTWLFAIAIVIVVATTGGAVIADRLGRRT